MSGHTPGPWRKAESGKEWAIVQERNSLVICSVHNNRCVAEDTNEANAALIAAAPDTAAERDDLKAVNAELIEMLERFDREFMDLAESQFANTVHNDPPETIVHARAVIAKHGSAP